MENTRSARRDSHTAAVSLHHSLTIDGEQAHRSHILRRSWSAGCSSGCRSGRSSHSSSCLMSRSSGRHADETRGKQGEGAGWLEAGRPTGGATKIERERTCDGNKRDAPKNSSISPRSRFSWIVRVSSASARAVLAIRCHSPSMPARRNMTLREATATPTDGRRRRIISRCIRNK